jgi:hypothetical protein
VPLSGCESGPDAPDHAVKSGRASDPHTNPPDMHAGGDLEIGQSWRTEGLIWAALAWRWCRAAAGKASMICRWPVPGWCYGRAGPAAAGRFGRISCIGELMGAQEHWPGSLDQLILRFPVQPHWSPTVASCTAACSQTALIASAARSARRRHTMRMSAAPGAAPGGSARGAPSAITSPAAGRGARARPQDLLVPVVRGRRWAGYGARVTGISWTLTGSPFLAELSNTSIVPGSVCGTG